MTDNQAKITPGDLESKFVELREGIESSASSAKDMTKKIGLVVVVLVVVLAFVLGRRRGKLSKTVVEIRRI